MSLIVTLPQLSSDGGAVAISFDALDCHWNPRTWGFSIVAMSISRSESQYGRRRSNTNQSAFKNTLPLELGASRVLTAWVHGAGDSNNVMLNHSHLPGVATGDLLRVTTSQLHDKSGFLFLALHEDPSIRPQLQVRHLPFHLLTKAQRHVRFHSQSRSLTPSIYEIIRRSP